MNKIVLVFGTRPELIKLAPVIYEFNKSGLKDNLIVVNTNQHNTLLEPHLKLFNIIPDYTLDINNNFNNLSLLGSAILEKLNELLISIKSKGNIKAIITQGDTSTAFCSSLFAFYNKIPVHHVEAGLRTQNINEPFPEEFHRKVISSVSSFHYAPTEYSKNNLLQEGYPENRILVCGNTIIDSIQLIEKLNKQNNIKTIANSIICTIHRRENLDENIIKHLNLIKTLALHYQHHNFIIIKHPNPKVEQALSSTSLKELSNINVINPLQYSDMLNLIKTAKLIISDSGGLQEEASYFLKPILILRNCTERFESIQNKIGVCFNEKLDNINTVFEKMLNLNIKESMKYIYGDGNASKKIVQHIKTL
ncbi:MAG: UDP-N-acetylglucosamine 2-epimerase (non-hydrolyzing) [Bacteroidales bacterium]|nr:UDP-N-acetylglucosamine 2-epimerase (non-hydrolyzing) [Bacteroidales bacterium]